MKQSIGQNIEQKIHLRDYLSVLRKRKAVIITFLTITLLTVIVGTFLSKPIYTASSQVLIERNIGAQNLDYQRVRYDPEFLATQFEIIKSANVARRVVDKLQLATVYRHFFFDDKKSSPAAEFISSVKSKAQRNIQKLLNKFFPSSFTGSAAEELKKIQNRADLFVGAHPLTEPDKIAADIQKELEIKPVPATKVVEIVYNAPHPGLAKLIADALVQSYMDELLEIKHQASSYRIKWMTTKAEDERKKLEDAEFAMQRYIRKNDLVTVENKLAIYPEKLARLSSQLLEAQAERKKQEALLAQIEGAGNNYKAIESIPVFSDSRVLQDIRERIYQAEQKIKELSKKFGPKHPTMKKAQGERDTLLKEKRLEIERIIDSTTNALNLAQSRETDLKESLESTKSELLDLNERFVQYSTMKRDIDTNRVTYEALTSSIKKASVTEQAQRVNVWVVKKAELPDFPSKPRKTLNLALGIILGLFGGIGLAFFVDYLDNTIKSGDELQERFGLTVLGAIERLKGRKNKIETYVLEQPLSPLTESYRLIKSGLLLSSAEHPPRTILVTSMSPSEGKTSTTANIARIFAQGEKKVLLIDCDLRRPRLHSFFSMPFSVGLSNYLTGNTEIGSIQREVPDEDRLTLIPAGPIPPNPAELLSSSKMQTLLDELTEFYDVIFLDSPPIQRVTDSLALGKIVDGTIIVTWAGKTTYDMLNSGIRRMREMNINLLGFVLNGLSKSVGADGYYYSDDDYYSLDSDAYSLEGKDSTQSS